MARSGRDKWAIGRAVQRSRLMLAAALVAPLLPGCAVQTLARGTPGTDLSGLGSGLSREQVEARLGAPARQWTTSAGVEYRMYRYDRGLAPNPADAAAIGFMDAISLGLVEFFWKLEPPGDSKPDHPRRIANIAVSYDQAGVALGVFVDVGEFADLPADGRGHVAR